MAKHEFGIIEDFDPVKDYDRDYVPEQYGCISIEDDLAQEAFMSKLSQMPTFFHTGRRPAKGFAYYGITLIPPSSLEQFKLAVDLEKNPAFAQLSQMLGDAVRRKKYIIHYGI